MSPSDDAEVDLGMRDLFRNEVRTCSAAIQADAVSVGNVLGSDQRRRRIEAIRAIRGAARILGIGIAAELAIALEKKWGAEGQEPVSAESESIDRRAIQFLNDLADATDEEFDAGFPNRQSVAAELLQWFSVGSVHRSDSTGTNPVAGTGPTISRSTAPPVETRVEVPTISASTAPIPVSPSSSPTAVQPPLPPSLSTTEEQTDPDDDKLVIHSGPSSSLFELFRDEVRSHTATLSDGVLALENELTNLQRIEPLMRAAHSIKGAARIVNVESGVQVAHVLEDVFVAAQRGKISLTADHIDVFLAAVDLFLGMSTVHEKGIAEWSRRESERVERLIVSLGAILSNTPLPLGSNSLTPMEPTAPQTALIGRAGASEPAVTTTPPNEAIAPPDSGAPSPTVVPSPKPVPTANSPQQTRVPTFSTTTESPREVTPAPRVEVPTDPPPDESVVRVTAASLNRLMGLAGESLVQARWLQPFSASMTKLRKQQELLAATIEAIATHPRFISKGDEFSQPMSELRRHMADCQSTLTARISEFEEHAAAADDLNSRLYREVIASRMRPFGDGTQGFPRLVRDMARKLKKNAKLEILGQSTEVDRDILEKLEAPLSHMIRNAMDHGLEFPAERVEAGKPAQGTLKVEARHRAGTLVITVSDDGRGIDIERLRSKIVERGMVTVEMARTLNEAELLEFLFLPGFSTASTVSEYSGRGVGLDVVQEMVRSVGGSLRLTTKLGKGTTFHLHLPITLSVVRAVLVVIAGESYAFPHNRIDRLLRVSVNEVHSLENRQFITIDGQNVGLIIAAQVMDLPIPPKSNDLISAVLISDSGNQYGLIVDSFTGEQDLVVRPLDPRLGKVPNIAAAAILDDGSPVLIADVEDIVRSMDGFIQTGNVLRSQRRESLHDRPSGRKRVLVVDDSVTVREVERQLLREMGHEVTLAVDGQDGWHRLRSGQFDLVVSDIDMPRMTGLEFLRLIRAEPDFRDLPVIIVSYKDRDEDRSRGLELGANFYLMKSSFHDNTFINAVRELIGG